jgi:hypothetical protein
VLFEPAYLPRYVAEVSGSVVGAVAITSGIVLLVKGSVHYLRHLRPRTVRLAGLAQFMFGVVVVLVAFAVDSEASCDGCSRDHWGGTTGVAGLIVWVLIVLGFVGAEARRWRTHRRS